MPPSPGDAVQRRARRGVPPRALLRSDGAQRGHRTDAHWRAGPRQPGVPRRHSWRARLDQRRVRRGHEDVVRHLHSLLPLPLRRARARRGQRQGADLQRQGRRPAVARQAEREAHRRRFVRSTRGLGCRLAPSRASPSSRRPARAATRQCPTPAAGRRACSPYRWTMREFCRERLLRFVFVDGEDARAQIHLVISRVEQALERAARDGDQTDASVVVDGTAVAIVQRPGRACSTGRASTA